jgi:hypothetical protein
MNMKNAKNEMSKSGLMKMMATGVRVGALATVINVLGLAAAYGEDLSSLRRRGLEEVSPLFLNKQVSIQAQLVSAEGPEWWERNFNTRVSGCPANPVTDPSAELSLNFSSGGAGSWAGDFDGINTKISKPTGAIGYGLAVPSNSTSRVSERQERPELEFTFDGTMEVKRALVDAAAEQIDRCFSSLPSGSYSGDQLSQLCPAPEVTRAQQRQTCVPYVSGFIGEKLADGSGYKVYVNQQTMCDFVGYGRSGNSNTNFTPCFFQRYEGVAKIDGGPQSTKVRALKAASKKALRACGKIGRKRDSRKTARCVQASMVKSMAR